jgi:hypothetical protein
VAGMPMWHWRPIHRRRLSPLRACCTSQPGTLSTDILSVWHLPAAIGEVPFCVQVFWTSRYDRVMTERICVEIAGGVIVLDAKGVEITSGLTMYVGMNGYAYYSRWSNGKSRPRTVHSLLMGTRRGLHIDHINGDRLDNRFENLRVVTPQMNQVNRRRLNRNNTAGVRGVTRGSSTKPWRAQITVNRKNIYLGSFSTLEEAAEARRLAELKYYGEECPK